MLEAQQGPVQCLALLDDDALLSGGNDGTLRVWRDGVCVATIAAHHDTCRGMARVPGLGVVTVSHDLTGKVRLQLVSVRCNVNAKYNMVIYNDQLKIVQ